jgi:aminoglycoside 6-adenylyltransferase
MDELEARVVSWANARPDIRAMVVIGSRARSDADEWSDLDVGFFTTDRSRYRASTDWLDEIGEVWLAYVDPLGDTRHVLFAGGLDAGIAPLSNRVLQVLPSVLKVRASRGFGLVPGAVRGVVDRRLGGLTSYAGKGMRLVLDKDGAGAAALAAMPPAPPQSAPPTAAEFHAAVHEFLFLAVWNAKHLRRGELWAAKAVGCDGMMKGVLLRMIEWQARGSHGSGDETWSGGRHLEEWADPGVLEDLRTTFAHYDEDDVWRATFATLEVFRRVAGDVAARFGFEYPAEADQRVSAWLAACEAGRRRSRGP